MFGKSKKLYTQKEMDSVKAQLEIWKNGATIWIDEFHMEDVRKRKKSDGIPIRVSLGFARDLLLSVEALDCVEPELSQFKEDMETNNGKWFWTCKHIVERLNYFRDKEVSHV